MKYIQYHASMLAEKRKAEEFEKYRAENFIDEYHYNAMYKVKHREIMQKIIQYLNEYQPKRLSMKDISYSPLNYYVGYNHYHLKGFVLEYGNIKRQYKLEKIGDWYENEYGFVDRGHLVTDDTIKAFVIELNHEYLRLQKGE
ncbi:hypothetical protein GGR02_003481 [Anoxybacillus voinovskiensis]|uniref:Uncharacterized protein n=1 Tax=Anoxybacteroides voinovskiense TaxID=230470 RepID=A0A840DYJ4_9BACL|nr:hypothetical protein [Anoxybacillus voinovskiensis]MBB4075627.1 hypothetical protein [Anoxybacillus voinovskiensis]GGJ80506.1 hypothetical protein GCM10008982_32570 [Anoxybacillus voinovskiensis]